MSILENLTFIIDDTEEFTDDSGALCYKRIHKPITLEEVDKIFPPGDKTTLVSQLTDELKLLTQYCSFLKCSCRSGESSAATVSYEEFKRGVKCNEKD